MPTVFELSKWHNDATTKVSNIIRSLGLSEVGIIWIFHNDTDFLQVIPSGKLVIPLILVIIGLACDLLQYVWQSLITHILYRKYERKYPKRKDREEKELFYSPCNNCFSYFMFYSKILLVIISYLFLGVYLFRFLLHV